MARAIVVVVVKPNGRQKLLGVFTQAKLALDALRQHGLSDEAEICAVNHKVSALTYATLVSRLRCNGKAWIMDGSEPWAFVQQTELNAAEEPEWPITVAFMDEIEKRRRCVGRQPGLLAVQGSNKEKEGDR